MSVRKIYPAKQLKGEITVPGDKSISHRAVMLGAIALGTTEINNFLYGADCLSTIRCFQKIQTAEQRRLAASGRTDNRKDFALFQ